MTTVRGVELVKVGRWDLSTGPWTVTPELLAAAVTAHASGSLARPVVKLGHSDPRFDGEPALGYVENLRLADGGRTLLGDLAGLPSWLSSIAATAYPRRSVEGVHDLTLTDGTRHAFVLTAVALLGATAPGIQTLADIPALVAASAGTPVTLTAPAPTTASDTRRALQVRAAASRRRHRNAAAILSTIENL